MPSGANSTPNATLLRASIEGFCDTAGVNFLLRLLLLLAATGPVAAQSVTATYQPMGQIRSPELRNLQADWQRNRLLETMAEQFSRQFSLRQQLKIGLGECGTPNAFYKSDAKIIVLCLELIPDLVNRVITHPGTRNLERDSIQNVVTGALVFIVFHELDHAIIDIERLPVLGREEDAADMLSTYLILQEPALADRGVAGGIFFFSKPASSIPGFFSQHSLSAEHALNPQRAANLACAAYGKDPQRFAWAMHAARVSTQRANRCASEYAHLDRSVRDLLHKVIR